MPNGVALRPSGQAGGEDKLRATLRNRAVNFVGDAG